ncbi:hypothetical protein BTR14_04105 [Rhizobium rhizosphaerae]|uniref:SnoaL-like domain-containing protein n=1 Tax=Xaviernesmea rhizosphaerae TaxID=1672749 RepID=A0ABX3PHS8_9HYPH|nr:nuclear transport factor 2 family protein [Xaviernesmea rhizosphaerae]OQP87750.1 hypothetical protein BTR14_04105 [Xaviernesmea rhizosphaerae]
MTDAQTLASRFMEALNARDFGAIAALLHEDAALDALAGVRVVGAEPFRLAVIQYLRHFDESFGDIVVLHDAYGQRAAIDTTARGHYRETQDGFPPAADQFYSIPSLFVFEVEAGLIIRLSHYRNLRLFEAQLLR